MEREMQKPINIG